MRKGAIQYSAAEMQWLSDNRSMVISDYHDAFVLTFGRSDVSAANLHSLRKRKGWKVGRAPGRFVGRRTKYTPEEIRWLADNIGLETVEWHAQFCKRFDRTDVSVENLVGLRKREGWKTGRDGRFETGAAPANKGKKMPFNPNSALTQFKPNQLPHNTKGAGHESLGDDGYMWIVTDRRNPWTGASTWRVHKHRWQWEQANGPVPEGMVLKCLDGNKLNCDPANWEAIPRGMLPRLNGKYGRNYDVAPAALKPTIMAVAKLEHRARAKRGARA